MVAGEMESKQRAVSTHLLTRLTRLIGFRVHLHPIRREYRTQRRASFIRVPIGIVPMNMVKIGGCQKYPILSNIPIFRFLVNFDYSVPIGIAVNVHSFGSK